MPCAALALAPPGGRPMRTADNESRTDSRYMLSTEDWVQNSSNRTPGRCTPSLDGERVSVRISLALETHVIDDVKPARPPCHRPLAYPWTEITAYPSTTALLPHMVLEPSPVPSMFSWSHPYMFRASGRSLQRLSCTPSPDLASNTLQTTSQTPRLSFV